MKKYGARLKILFDQQVITQMIMMKKMSVTIDVSDTVSIHNYLMKKHSIV